MGPLVALLGQGPDSEATQHATTVVRFLTTNTGTLEFGTAHQDEVRTAGGVAPLVALLRGDPMCKASQQALGALVNIAANNMPNQQARGHPWVAP